MHYKEEFSLQFCRQLRWRGISPSKVLLPALAGWNADHFTWRNLNLLVFIIFL